jgi:hypothetical protein
MSKEQTKYIQELEYIDSEEFILGEYIYMGMGKVADKNVCISVGYKIDYAFKKAAEFVKLANNVKFESINKVKVGELEKCEKFIVDIKSLQNEKN